MRVRSLGAWGALVAVGVVASCGADHRETSSDRVEAPVSATALTPSSDARESVEALRERFRITPMARPDRPGRAALPAPKSVAVIGRAVATSFEPSDGGRVRAVIPVEAKRGVLRAASVELPTHANAMARVEDDVTHVSVGFALRGASDVGIAVADGMAVYAGALGGSDVVHRVHAEGTEDFVVFEERPAKEELVYDVDVSRVAGLRLVSNTLEFLDEGGAPRLRVAPPYVVDARGVRSEARLAVEGCAYDRDTSGPWGRAVTKAGATSCVVRVGWKGLRGAGYPLIVDPSWVATGSMATARQDHTATLLNSGMVLVAGGQNTGYAPVASAELFDGIASFATTSSMATARALHTATLLPSGKVLVAGGFNQVSGNLASAELFDGTATFAPAGSMATARVRHTATLLLSGQVLLAGVNIGGSPVASAEFFNGTNAFVSTGSMATARAAHTATLLTSAPNAGKVLVAGGYDATDLASAELFDGTGSFASTGSMATAREDHTATLLPSGKVLVAGGSGSYLNAELFDGNAAFAPTGSMATAREDHTATLLLLGQVLIVGGDNGSANLASAELFDGSATFALTGAMPTVREYHTATLLPSGKVVIAGGSGPSGVTTTAELFGLVGGSPCALASDCGSGICNEKCCMVACAGSCTTCDGTGACVPVENADDANSCMGSQTCDPSGACKLKISQPCPGGAVTCASGFCSDAVCCNSACSGECDTCSKVLGASADGVCTVEPEAYGGNPVCGSGIACDGINPTCPAACLSDIDCVATDYCSANGTCQPQKLQGASCDFAADCKSTPCRECPNGGNCADGVCCDSPCNTLCQACTAALKQSGAMDGTCGPAKNQTNPHNDACTPSMPSTCGADGLCDGNGACSLHYPAGTSCGTSLCVAGNKAAGDICDGSGLCQPNPQGIDCGETLCANGSCAATCASDSDCITTAYCKQSTCVPKQSNAATCTSPDQCSSGICADGFCCNTACTGQCEACNLPAAPGVCSPVSSAPVGMRKPCIGVGATCGGTCDGTNTAACTYPSGTTTCATSCAKGEETVSACNAHGACIAAAPQPCPGNIATCASATACTAACVADTDCTEAFVCKAGVCIPKAGATCAADGHTVVDSGGNPTDCTPYICSGGMCAMSCGTVDDCVAPNVCDATGKCSAPAAPNSGESGGCAIASTPRQSAPSRAPSLFTALALAALALRRRRAARSSRRRPSTPVQP